MQRRREAVFYDCGGQDKVDVNYGEESEIKI